LRKTIDGPGEDGQWRLGTLHFPDACDGAFFKQLTAEYLKPTVRKDRVVREWVKLAGQANEQLDIAVGARAMAAHLGLDHWSADRWRRVAEERGSPPEQAQRDLTELWSPPPGAAADAHEAALQPAPHHPA
jgi:phage terminase large subunit GpA-like protein